MKKTLQIFSFTFLLLIVCTVLDALVPLSHWPIEESKWRWIDRELSRENPPPLDLVFLGTSVSWTAVNMEELASVIGSRAIRNYGRNWPDRQVDYILARRLLESTRVKYLVLEATAAELEGRHRFGPYVMTWGDLADDFNHTLRYTNDLNPFSSSFMLRVTASDYASCLGILMTRFPLRLATTFKGGKGCDDVLCAGNDRTLGFLVNDADLVPNKKNLMDGEDGLGNPVPITTARLPSTRVAYYLEKIVRLAQEHHTEVVFVVYPHRDHLVPAPEALSFYRRFAKVIAPDPSELRDRSYWFDRQHLFQDGSRLFARRLGSLMLQEKMFEAPARAIATD